MSESEGEKGREEEVNIGELRSIEGKVTAWGTRLQVPAAILKEIGLSVGDNVVWRIEGKSDKKVAILMKKWDVKKKKWKKEEQEL